MGIDPPYLCSEVIGGERAGTDPLASGPLKKRAGAILLPKGVPALTVLTPEHLSHLRESAISDAIIAKRGYKSVGTKSPELSPFIPKRRVPGIFMQFFGPDDTKRAQLRPDEPVEKEGGHLLKYLFTAGSTRIIDTLHANGLRTTKHPIVLCEGLKKGDSLASQPEAEGLCILVLDGCSGGLGPKQVGLREPLDTADLQDRYIYICLDADLATNRQVWTAGAKLKAALDAEGAKTRIVRLPVEEGDKEGLDDYIARGGDWKALFKDAAAEMPPEPPWKRAQTPGVRLIEEEGDGMDSILPPPPAAEGYVPRFTPGAVDGLEKKGDRLILPGPSDDPDTLGKVLSIHYGIRLRTNQRTQAIEYDQQTGWIPAEDSWRAALRLALGRDWTVEKVAYGGKRITYKPWRPEKAICTDWLDQLSTDQVEDDVAAFFQRCQLTSAWDGIPRIAHMLDDLLGAANTVLNRWASASLFVGTVLATMQPGKRRRGVVTLVGPQYSGKTTLLTKLLPSGLDRYCSSMSLHGDDKTRTEKLLGNAVVELGELAGKSRVETEQLKSWLTHDVDYVRLAFRRDPVRIPRRALIVASINEGAELPRDPSGSTRWVCVECPRKLNVEAEIDDEMRLQWWAEAVHVANQEGPGDPDTLTRGWFEKGIPHLLLEEQAEANQSHESRNETIENLLINEDLPTGTRLTAVEIAQNIGYLPRQERDGLEIKDFRSKPQRDEFCAELRQNGWKSMPIRRGKNVIKGWGN